MNDPRGAESRAVTNNRLAWAAAQRYRYCELGVRPDQLRQSWAWARIPLLLATLRCSDYVVHLDADAFVMRPEWGVESYLRQMQERRASLLVTRDYLDLKRSPINFGVCSPDAGDGPQPSKRRHALSRAATRLPSLPHPPARWRRTLHDAVSKPLGSSNQIR